MKPTFSLRTDLFSATTESATSAFHFVQRRSRCRKPSYASKNSINNKIKDTSLMELELQPFTLPGIDSKRPLVIAGPCSAESEEQVLNTAKQLSHLGIQIFRAGIWKPRTKPGGFEGVGEQGLTWLKEVKEETGMLTTT